MEISWTSKGQATIPKAIREHLGLKPGDRVEFLLHPDGSVALLPKRPASILRGIVEPRRRAVTVAEICSACWTKWTRRRPRLIDWFERVKARPTFHSSFLEGCPAELTRDLKTFGTHSWPDVERILLTT